MKSILLLLCACCMLPAYAQLPRCGSDEQRDRQLQTDPRYRQKEERLNRQLYERAIHPPEAARSPLSIRYVPVVVHIIHQNGPENLSDSAVIAGISQLNLRFRNAAPYTDPSGHDVQIQFCLASVDPFGNPTTGITRTVSPMTDMTTAGTSDLALKNLNRWNTSLYLNIWTVKNTYSPTEVAGYSTFPASAGTGLDGIVIGYAYFNQSSLTHEAGHYLGLYHTFSNGCTNNNCLLDGDYVCDTPPDATSNFTCPANSCSTEMNDTSGFNPFTGDVNDAPNYMDYTYCPLSFTAGQSDRMNAALTSARATLLLSNGCGAHPGGSLPVAAFTASPSCGGTSFTSTGINTVGAEWDFNSDGIIDDAGTSFTYNAPSTGYYSVTMYAQGYGGMDTLTQTVFIQHYPFQNYPMNNGYGGLVLSSIPGHFRACEGTTVSFYGAPGMAHYYWSNGDTTQNAVFVQGSASYDMSLITVDSAGNTWSTCYPVHVDAAPATVPPTISIAPGDTAFCTGSPLHLLFSYSPIWAAGSFNGISGFHSSAYTVTLNMFNNFVVTQTDANGCVSSSNTINITASNPTYPNHITNLAGSIGYLYYGSGSHFQWYHDGAPYGTDTAWLALSEPGCYSVYSWWLVPACGSYSQDTVCFATTGITEQDAMNARVIIAPNPFSDETVITFPGAQKNTRITITDLVGREVRTMVVNGSSVTVERGALSKGIYWLRITDDKKNCRNRKLVIQ